MVGVAASLLGAAFAIAAALIALVSGSASAAQFTDFIAIGGLAAVGAVLSLRVPRHPIGRLFCLAALVLGLQDLLIAYATLSVRDHAGALPATEAVAWVTNWLWLPPFAGIGIFLFLLFPDGRLPSGRWRPVAWLGGASLLMTIPARAVAPGPLEEVQSLDNPLGFESLEALVVVVWTVGVAAMLTAIIASAVSLAVRLRDARGRERQQLKWVAYAALLAGAAFVIGGPFWPAVPAQIAVLSGFTAIPAAAGIAILRHRLYDIDVVINRTLIYGVLTATLASAYLGMVLLLQLALSPLTAESDLAIAASTLAVAALFRPARRRIQELVDRRFYRRRYDAARTLETFAARLREEVDLDTLSVELRAVVRETMQPAHVSLWLREPSQAALGRGHGSER